MKIFISILFLILTLDVEAQFYNPVDISPSEDFENIFVKKLYSDSFTTTFIIWIKKDVPLHKHAHHTEQLIILEGAGQMTVGTETFELSAGDFLIIPKDTPHALVVNSATPMKVISIQAPEFDGSDRIMLSK